MKPCVELWQRRSWQTYTSLLQGRATQVPSRRSLYASVSESDGGHELVTAGCIILEVGNEGSVGEGGEVTPRKSCWLDRSAFAPTKGVESTFSLLAATTRATTNLFCATCRTDGNEIGNSNDTVLYRYSTGWKSFSKHENPRRCVQ
jgi:hypothetical protein